MTKFSRRDESITVFTEDFECFLDFLLGVSVLQFTCHHGKKFWKVNSAISISINLVDHVLQLSFGRVLS